MAFYALFYFLWQSSSDFGWATLFFKWCIVGVVLINSAFVHFTFVLLNFEKRFKKRLFLIHLIDAIYCYAALRWFYQDWMIKYNYGLWPVPSKIFHTYLIWWFFQVIYCYYLLYRKGVILSTGKEKTTFQWVFWSTLIAYTGGATNWLVWYGINFPPYLNSGIAAYSIVLVYAIFRYQLLDIGEIFEAAQRNKLETMGILAASINHELRNPIYIIRLTAEAFLLKKPNPNKEEALQKATEALEQTLKQADRALNLMGQLIRFLKQDESAPLAPVPLRELLERLHFFTRYEIQIHNIELVYEIPEDLPPLLANSSILEQVFFNLIVNASQVLKKQTNGIIRIKANQIPAGIRVSVEDNGPGIPANLVSKIFEPFYSTKKEGLGLGLYITKRLVEKNNGKISVESVPGKTVFHLIFKAHEPKTSQTPNKVIHESL